MTEAEWLASDDPEAMFVVVTGSAFLSRGREADRTKRKRDFFSAACCRLVWPWIVVDERCRRAVESIETQFETPISEGEFEDLWDGVKAATRHPDDGTPVCQMIAAGMVYDSECLETLVAKLACDYEGMGNVKVRAAQVAHIMRDIVGNPFRPVTFALPWRTSNVMLLAQGIYDDRAFDHMPILADALQDAGCDNADVLDHCRSKATHVRGCWVVDLVLGKA